MKKVLITGVAGFLGSYLCDWFIAEGFSVIAKDNLITVEIKSGHTISKDYFQELGTGTNYPKPMEAI